MSLKSKTQALLSPLTNIWQAMRKEQPIQILAGMENRPDNLQMAKDFFYIDIVNTRASPAVISDIALVYQNPAKVKPVRTAIVSEQREYPVSLPPKSNFKIHLLPSLVDFPRLSGISVKISGAKGVQQNLLLPVSPAGATDPSA